MPNVFYLPGTDGADEFTDATSKAVFRLDGYGRCVASVTDKVAEKLRGRQEFWVEGDARPEAPEETPEETSAAAPSG